MSEAGRGNWQTIKTAPKDGRDILVISGDWVVKAHWDRAQNCWMASANHFECMPEDQQPTDWQPLPDPPQATQ